MTDNELLKAFEPAISGGKISGRWRLNYAKEGQAILNAVPDAESISEALFRIKNGIERPKCATCGGHIKFSHKRHEYSRFCSPRCGQLNSEVRAKLKETNLEKYGVENPGAFGSDKFKEAMQEKYGANTPMRSEILKDKVKATNLEKYGAKNVFASEHGKKKIVETMMTNYGVSCSMKDPGVKQKFRTEDGSWKPAVMNKDLRIQNRTATEKARVTLRLQEFGFTLIETRGVLHRAENKHVLQHECGHIFESHLSNGLLPICRKCNPKLCGTSLLQKKVEDFLISLNIDFVIGGRILDGKELDILIPSINLGLEINGLYWHSTQAGKDPKYHLIKTEAALAKGITLVHLFEDDLVYRWDIVQSMLKVKLGLAKRIYARQCIVEEISKKEATAFCNQYHLKKSARFEMAYGLRHNGVLVCVGTFGKPRYSKIGDLELIRFCSISDTVIVGGMSKILSKIPKSTSLISYADRSYATGEAYKKAGFKLYKILPPNYSHFKSPENLRTHQTQLRKYKLLRSNATLDSSKTERQLLAEAGWNQIWDCGQFIFILNSDIITEPK